MALPDFRLEVSPEELAPLAARLNELGYSEEFVRELMGTKDTSEMVGGQLPFYQRRCYDNGSPAALLVAFFLLGEGLTKEQLLDLLGAELTGVLVKCRAIVGFSGVFTCQVTLYPCQGRYFFTDFWYTVGQQPPGKIYEIGTDSYVLSRTTPRDSAKNTLDLCTGSGIHAILSASIAPATAVDINPRALEYTKINAALNSVQVETHLGDLYSCLEGQRKFDLITANPPFVPSPDPVVLIHRSPGESGEEVTEQIVAGLPQRLTDDGLLSMILEYPVIENDDYADRLERWLGQTSGWGIAVLWYIERPLGEYVVAHMGPVPSYRETFEKYLDSYRRHGIVAIRFASVFIKRLAPGTPNWKVTEGTVWPKFSIDSQIHDWLTCLTRYHDPNWSPDPDWTPRLSEYYLSVWRDWDDARGVLEPSVNNWIQPTPLDADETELLMRLKSGQRSVRELLAEWAEDGLEKETFYKVLRSVGLRRALV